MDPLALNNDDEKTYECAKIRRKSINYIESNIEINKHVKSEMIKCLKETGVFEIWKTFNNIQMYGYHDDINKCKCFIIKIFLKNFYIIRKILFDSHIESYEYINTIVCDYYDVTGNKNKINILNYKKNKFNKQIFTIMVYDNMDLIDLDEYKTYYYSDHKYFYHSIKNINKYFEDVVGDKNTLYYIIQYIKCIFNINFDINILLEKIYGPYYKSQYYLYMFESAV